MNRTLSEIDAIIEAEVERRCAHRMRGYSAELRTMADRMWYEEFGDRPAQMTEGIEIVPSKQADDQPKIDVNAAYDAERPIINEDKAPDVVPDLKLVAEQFKVAREIPMLQPANADASDAIPDGSPEWLAPVLEKLRPAKEKDIARRIAAEGGVTLQEVIYHFRPPIKETYATVILSNVRTALKRSGMALTRDAEGVYRVGAEA